jgi:hypothetical protein
VVGRQPPRGAQVAAGATVKYVQRMLGHASATLTQDRYGHLFADELDDVVARLDDAMRDADVATMWARADPTLFTSAVRRTKMPSELRFCWVPPAGFEPATHGLGTLPSVVRGVS